MADRPRTVLIVEDDPDLLALEEAVLAEAGYRVASAADGVEALERVEREMPGLILLDMRMPRMDGWNFAREFRARHGDACPIAVITAAENARLRAQEIQAHAWLEKPFDLEDVLALVARHLGPPAPPPGAPAGAPPSP
ncbi:MAG TPA: response regulator [Anaeromyxobacteraceae bacterium]|nr:response regulator [Anaeromyxobacteraceae bacterium]